MRNQVGLRSLFGENHKAIRLFIDWCRECDELCEYDYEHICISLELGAIDNTPKFFHFHTGNIITFLEEQDYYIGTMPRLSDLNYVGIVHYAPEGVEVQKPIYWGLGVKDRYSCLELAVTAAINHLEKRLWKQLTK
ncbi:MAG: hypothetical protein PQJ49_01060 [Sphaerochaetaceae bacterium]|nr:hypothetical protein [Sphaerochaetaceae bacterium]